MPKSTVTITGEQRRAIYHLIRAHLGGLSDVCLALDREDFATAEKLGLEFGEDFRLLEDLGWEEGDNRPLIALTMPAEDLTETLKRLRAEAEGLFAESPDERRLTEEEEKAKARSRLVIETCDELIPSLDPRKGGAA
jgi:hypothetical protein